MFDRYKVYGRRHDTVFPFAESLPVPARSDKQLQEIDRNVVMNEQTEARKTEHAALDTSFARYGELNPVVFPAAGVSVNILTFTVPPGRVLTIKKVYFVLNEPFLYVNDQIGWRLAVNGGQVPFHNRAAAVNSGQLTLPYAGINGDPELSPVYIQSNANVSIELVELLTFGIPTVAITDYIAAACYVFGELRKPIGGRN